MKQDLGFLHFEFDIDKKKEDDIKMIKTFFNSLNISYKQSDKKYDEEQIKKDSEEFFSKYVGMFDDKGLITDDDIKDIRLERFSK